MILKVLDTVESVECQNVIGTYIYENKDLWCFMGHHMELPYLRAQNSTEPEQKIIVIFYMTE